MQSLFGVFILFLLLLCQVVEVCAQEQLPIIDIHLHSYHSNDYFVAPDQYGNMAPKTVDDHFDATYEGMRRHNIVLGVVSGSLTSEEAWISRDPDGRLLRGFGSANLPDVSPEAFETLVKKGEVDVFGEIGAYYRGLTLVDPLYEPYLKICEQYEIPVAYHTGGGRPKLPTEGLRTPD